MLNVLNIVPFLNCNHPSGRKVDPFVALMYVYPVTGDAELSSPCVCWHFMYFPLERVCSKLFCKYFHPACHLALNFLRVSFEEEMFFTLMKSNLWFFSSLLGSAFQYPLSKFCFLWSRRYSPRFSFRRLLVSPRIFRYVHILSRFLCTVWIRV